MPFSFHSFSAPCFRLVFKALYSMFVFLFFHLLVFGLLLLFFSCFCCITHVGHDLADAHDNGDYDHIFIHCFHHMDTICLYIYITFYPIILDSVSPTRIPQKRIDGSDYMTIISFREKKVYNTTPEQFLAYIYTHAPCMLTRIIYLKSIYRIQNQNQNETRTPPFFIEK